ncbi:MAG: thioredoxin domain-containing protein [Gammaproteobacteria bacterium]|nr:thioredoxin domain-containing protein [Gammaproteobacteria bacterium]
MPNQLATETSPYLQQHRHNPVDWHPWNGETLDLARQQGKPILLSIGYSACHWCHVMAHESFEDPATAELMNERFINIKVDREERPDLDKIYQLAHQLLAQRPGGWPLTVFLTPDQLPYFAGTYFPKEPKYNMPTFRDILLQTSDAYHQQGEAIAEQNQSLLEALENTNRVGDLHATLTTTPLDTCRRELEKAFDQQYGGFGKAPKFPHPTFIERLLRHWQHTKSEGHEDSRARELVHIALHAMASGGIYDQLGSGFCRYSTDDMWMIPHFEKMLYDNGQLLSLYANAWAATNDPVFRRITEETGSWLLAEMRSSEGGFYSAQDADTEGEEGKFYVWQPDDVKQLLDNNEYVVFAPVYGFDREANFEGNWYPHMCVSPEQVAEQLSLHITDVQQRLASAKEKLYQARQARTQPHIDEKILTSWNGLAIKGLANAAYRLKRDDFLQAAQQAIDFIHANLWKNGRLLASYKDGQARLQAYLDDYAYLLDALLALLQAHWRTKDCRFAIELADTLLTHFWDHTKGAFYFTADDHETLIHRTKPSMDESIPSGNGIAAYALQRLGHLLGRRDYLQAAEQCLKGTWEAASQLPHNHSSLLHALEEWLYPTETIILRGQGKELEKWFAITREEYQPRRQCYAIATKKSALPGLLDEKAGHEECRAWICDGSSCQPAIDEFEQWQQTLASSR